MTRDSHWNRFSESCVDAGTRVTARLCFGAALLKRMPRLVVMATLAISVMVAGKLLWACPFCLSPPMTLAEEISTSELVVIVELLRFDVVQSGDREYPWSTVRIREYLQGADLVSKFDRLKVGQAFLVRQEIAGTPGDLFLMFGSVRGDSTIAQTTFAADSGSPQDAGVEAGALVTADFQVTASSGNRIQRSSLVIPELISWNSNTPVSPEAIRYIKNAPPRSQPASQRLLYFTEFLEHRDPLLSIDAWSEFANSSYDDVKAIRDAMPREKLRQWISDPQMSPERLGLYGMMLGLCGDASDAEFLKTQIGVVPPSAKEETLTFRYGTDGLMGGYLLLTGEDGLTFLEQTRLNANAPADSASAAMQAIQFVWSYESDLVPTARLRSAMRRMLFSADQRTITIANLARWKDWECWPELEQIFHGDGAADHATRKAVVFFAEECQKATNDDGSATTEAVAAASFLARAQVEFPELFRSSYKSDFNSPN